MVNYTFLASLAFSLRRSPCRCTRASVFATRPYLNKLPPVAILNHLKFCLPTYCPGQFLTE